MEERKSSREEVRDLDEEMDELNYLLALHGISLRSGLDEIDESFDENDDVEKGSWSGAPLDLGAKSKKRGPR